MRIAALLVAIVTVSFSSQTLADDLILTGDIVTMTSRQGILHRGVVLIRDGMIHEMSSHRCGGRFDDVQVLEVVAPLECLNLSSTDPAVVVLSNWRIFPGLINIHNHTLYGTLPPAPIERGYANRYEWQPDDNVADLTPFLGPHPPINFNIGRSELNPFVEYPRLLLTDSVLYGNAVAASKWAEIKALVGGTTTIEGSIPSAGVVDILVRNAEHENFGSDKVFRTTQDITDPAFESSAAQLVQGAENGLVDAFLVHLAEGTDASSLAEYDKLKELGLLQDWTVIVHGVPFDRDIFDEMAAAGADLVWSPTSQLALYGQDARADLALNAGVNVSLGTDWGVSAPKNLLFSLKMAWELNHQRKRSRNTMTPRYEPFSEYELVRMVTANPAQALGWEDRLGQIREGMVADLMVVGPSDRTPGRRVGNPYRVLIDATERDVQLVLVGGDPLYGELDIMDVLKPGDYELVGDGTFLKAIDVTKDGVVQGDQSIEQLESQLASAMELDLFDMFGTFPVVQLISALTGQPVDVGTFAFLFGVIFHDYLPEGTPFPPGPADLSFFFRPGSMSLPLTPIYTSGDEDFFYYLETHVNADFPDIRGKYYMP